MHQERTDEVVVIDLAQEKPNPSLGLFENPHCGKFSFLETTDLAIGLINHSPPIKSHDGDTNEKIALVGANEMGKTALLKVAMGYIKPCGKSHLGEYLLYPGYFEQEKKMRKQISPV